MNIRKIITKAGGCKGLEVHYVKMDENKGKIGEVTKTEYKRPIQLNLDKQFRELRYFLLEVAGILNGTENKMEKDYAISDCRVSGVKMEDGGFALIGDVTVIGNKRMKLETPLLVEDDEYVNYEAVKGMLEAILEETELYMNDKVVLNNDELVERWINYGNDKKVDKDAYENMSLEDKKIFHIKVLEEAYGIMVLDAGDVGEIDEIKLEEIESEFLVPVAEVEEEKEEEKNEFEIGDVNEIIIPVKEKVKK